MSVVRSPSAASAVLGVGCCRHLGASVHHILRDMLLRGHNAGRLLRALRRTDSVRILRHSARPRPCDGEHLGNLLAALRAAPPLLARKGSGLAGSVAELT